MDDTKQTQRERLEAYLLSVDAPQAQKAALLAALDATPRGGAQIRRLDPSQVRRLSGGIDEHEFERRLRAIELATRTMPQLKSAAQAEDRSEESSEAHHVWEVRRRVHEEPRGGEAVREHVLSADGRPAGPGVRRHLPGRTHVAPAPAVRERTCGQGRARDGQPRCAVSQEHAQPGGRMGVPDGQPGGGYQAAAGATGAGAVPHPSGERQARRSRASPRPSCRTVRPPHGNAAGGDPWAHLAGRESRPEEDPPPADEEREGPRPPDRRRSPQAPRRPSQACQDAERVHLLRTANQVPARLVGRLPGLSRRFRARDRRGAPTSSRDCTSTTCGTRGRRA